MPEGPEVELESVHHAIHHEAEHDGGPLMRWIALSTSVLAALAAVASLQAGHTVNEALLLKTEATRLQDQASNQWAYYEAKGIKSAVQETQRAAWLAAHEPPPPSIDAKVAQYAKDQADIKKEAEARERERDARSIEADGLLAKHNKCGGAVAMFQVAIALGGVAALTRLRLVWLGSMALGLVGLVMFVMANLHP